MAEGKERHKASKDRGIRQEKAQGRPKASLEMRQGPKEGSRKDKSKGKA
jgi:hypothetical protein